MHGYLCLAMLCVVRYISLHRVDHSSGGVLPNVVDLNECDREASITRRSWPTRGSCAMKESKICVVLVNFVVLCMVYV